MNLKYYLRGLGLGIIVTAIVLGLGTRGKAEPMSDEEIISRARKLGMIENTVLSPPQEEAGPAEQTAEAGDAEAAMREESSAVSALGQEGEEAPPVITESEETTAEEDLSEMTGAEEATNLEAGSDGTEAEEEASAAAEGEGIGEVSPVPSVNPSDPTAFIVQSGENPSSISRRLQEGGWIADAEEFKTFLVNNGYDTLIVASEYHFPVGADMDTIAKIITQNRRMRNMPTQPELPIPTVPEEPPATE